MEEILKEFQAYKASDNMVNCFNVIADGYSHSFRVENNQLFFSALTHNAGVVQVYGKTGKEIEDNFIKAVNIEIKRRKNRNEVIQQIKEKLNEVQP